MPNKNNFMFLVDELNWKVVKSKNIIGTENLSTFQEIKPGDNILIYITRLSEIKAYYEVISTYKDNTRIFSGKIYPYRLELKLIKVFKKKANFYDLILKLDFIKNKAKWFGHLFGIKGLRKLSSKDFDTIRKNLE